ncbi:MAG: bifunctional GNAT family N-acetyltransferase/acetate--CoA ligase family protein [Halobacteriaceae archaeon]
MDSTGQGYLITPDDPPYEESAKDLTLPEGSQIRANDLILTAAIEDTILGYTWLQTTENGTYTVQIDVDPDYQNTNLDTELARQAIAYAVANGGSRLIIEDPQAFRETNISLTETTAGQYTAPLTGPQVSALMTPPADEQSHLHSSISDVDGSNLASNATADEVPQTLTSIPETEDQYKLADLFNPDTVAVVGATDREDSIGRILMENLSEFMGDIIPVSPRAETVLEYQAKDTLTAVDDADLAVIALPPEKAIKAVENAGKAGIETVIVVSAGFKETGSETYTRELRTIASRYDLTLVGPNSMGVMSTISGLNATFSPRHPTPGSISVISQSGAFITATIGMGSDRGLGFRNIVSVGNKAVIDETDFLSYFDADPGTDVIIAYLEDIAHGEDFVETASTIISSTPVVVLKGGRTEQGAKAAQSHTGALVNDTKTIEAAFKRAGVLQVHSTEALLDYAVALTGPLPDGENIGVITNAGGPGVLATDALDSEDCELASFEPETQSHLSQTLPEPASTTNPVDILGDADADRFAATIDTVIADSNVDIGITVSTPHPLIEYSDLITAVGSQAQIRNTPVLTCLMGGTLSDATRRALRQYNVANYSEPSRLARGVNALQTYQTYRERPPVDPPDIAVDYDSIETLIDQAQSNDRDILGPESLSILEACGIETPMWELATSAEEAASIAHDIGSDVVLKVVSPDIVHKSDVGGIRTDVPPDSVLTSYEDLLSTVQDNCPAARIDGVVVQEMIDIDDGVETAIGISSSRFGPLVMFGLGGVFIEELDDIALALAPLDDHRARQMIRDIDGYSILKGARSTEEVDIEGIIDALVRLSILATDIPEIADLDINPLLATPGHTIAVDLHVELGSEN